MPLRPQTVGQIYAPGSTDKTLKMLVCGTPGAGKTLFGSTFPNPVYLDLEGNLLSIRNRRDILVYRIRSSSDVEEVFAMLDQEPNVRRSLLGGYDARSVIFDTVDEYARMLERERNQAENQEGFRIQDWGWFGEKLRGSLRGFRNIRGLHVVFNCHVREDRDESGGRVRERPDIRGAVSNEIASYVDEAFLLTNRLRYDNNGNPVVHRFLQTYPDMYHDWAKDQSGALPPEFGLNFTDDFARMYRMIFGEDPPSTEQAEGAEEKPRRKGKAVPEAPVGKAANGRITKPAVVDVPLPDDAVVGEAASVQVAASEPSPAPEAAVVLPEGQVLPVVEGTVTSVTEPEAEAEAVPEVGTESPPDEPAAPKCTKCGEEVANPNLVELSRARFNEVLCPAHFKERRDAK